jgi:hypothetical protein
VSNALRSIEQINHIFAYLCKHRVTHVYIYFQEEEMNVDAIIVMVDYNTGKGGIIHGNSMHITSHFVNLL